MANTIRIHKQAGTKKDAIRVNTSSDIPEFLKSTISIEDGQVKLLCVEGFEVAPLGSVIGYEDSKKTSTGWNAWCIGNAATNLVERDGIFYKKATILTAQQVNDEAPDFVEGANIRHNSDGSWTIVTDWGESTGFPGEAYWVLYGQKADGTPMPTFSLRRKSLTKTTSSAMKATTISDGSLKSTLLNTESPLTMISFVKVNKKIQRFLLICRNLCFSYISMLGLLRQVHIILHPYFTNS